MEEEDEEAAERGSVGRLRGKEMLHNQLSRVFSRSLYLYFLLFLRVIEAHSSPSALIVSALLSCSSCLLVFFPLPISFTFITILIFTCFPSFPLFL